MGVKIVNAKRRMFANSGVAKGREIQFAVIWCHVLSRAQIDYWLYL